MIHFRANLGNNFRSLKQEKAEAGLEKEQESDDKSNKIQDVKQEEIKADAGKNEIVPFLDIDFTTNYGRFVFYGENTKPYRKV